jgi:hypothetical protein
MRRPLPSRRVSLRHLRITPNTLVRTHASKYNVRQARLGEAPSSIVPPLREFLGIESGVAVELVVGEGAVDGPGHRETDMLDEVCG